MKLSTMPIHDNQTVTGFPSVAEPSIVIPGFDEEEKFVGSYPRGGDDARSSVRSHGVTQLAALKDFALLVVVGARGIIGK